MTHHINVGINHLSAVRTYKVEPALLEFYLKKIIIGKTKLTK